ncbi:TerC family protein [Candidatus Shikimatogenerans silvanidophilus]|uniref:TerC family protein n=1 Tax=Candidatus Shikimatogenerans silvanidophilus TaxID=2782547 RepID=UPI001BA53E34|nr:DUF475 domain-containing protein [Candidatus Shikimatogenerans silvanidophilus]
MEEQISYIFINPFKSIITLINIIIVEILLSIDNAIIISSFIEKIKNKKERKKIFNYGIIGACFFRFFFCFFYKIIEKIWWIKTIGGIYLLFISVNTLFEKNKGLFYNKKKSFWLNVFLIELIDLSFSIDNVLSCISLSKNIILILFGNFIGILLIRFIINKIIILVSKFYFLKKINFFIIFILGLKLFLSSFNIINLTIIENIISLILLLLFIIIIIYYFFFKKNDND